MGTFSIWHWLIVIVVVVLLFGGAGRIPRLMGDMAKGVKAFKSGMKDESDDNAAAKKQVTNEGGETTTTSETVERDKNVA
jgi:sec-independent protein translocase protein TatA